MRFLNTATAAALAAALLAGPVFAADIVSPSGSAAAPVKSTVSKDISRQAYLDLAGERFDAMDANHDGTLTVAERQAAHHGKRHSHGTSGAAPSAPSTTK